MTHCAQRVTRLVPCPSSSMHHSWTQQPAPEHTKNHLSRGSPVMAATTALLLAVMLACAATCARAATQQSEFYLLLEDGTKVTYGMLRELAGPNRACCFPVPWKWPVVYSSTGNIRLFISNSCDPGFEVNSSAYPVNVKQVDLCAQCCDPAKGCGLNGMNTKGVSTRGGKSLVEQGGTCADFTGRRFMDKTCRVINGQRMNCRQDCSGTYTCQENSFDRSMCPGAGVQTVFVALGERCGYMQDNKQYACGGNKVSCTNSVCTSSYPPSKDPRSGR